MIYPASRLLYCSEKPTNESSFRRSFGQSVKSLRNNTINVEMQFLYVCSLINGVFDRTRNLVGCILYDVNELAVVLVIMDHYDIKVLYARIYGSMSRSDTRDSFRYSPPGVVR